MLTEAIVQSSTPMSFKIEDLVDDEILILTSITNLTSVKVNQFMGEFAREGGYYQGRRAQPRNPVMNFKLNPNYTEDIAVSDIRELLYRTFMEPQRDSDAVQVLLKDDRRPDRYFLGYTESIESDQWEQEQTAAVSLMTTDAYLRSVANTQNTSELGWFSTPLVYEGSADTGLEIEIKVTFPTPSVTLRNGIDYMYFSGPFVAGDTLYINTMQGSRAILLNGVDHMAAMTASSRWIQVKEQTNVLKVWGATENDGKAKIMGYSYRAAWWGI